MRSELLIVDDDEGIRSQMKWALSQDYDVILAEDRPAALETFKARRPAVVLLDLGLPPHPGDPEEGLAALSEMLTLDNLTKTIVITGQAERDVALRAIAEGAYDFLCKPVEMDELKVILKRAYYVAQLEMECRKMRQFLGSDTFEGMLGTSPQMQEVFHSIRKVATTNAAVLVLGESGTGKEMAALAIHRRSLRKEGPFVAINCGAIPETLLESELFGHEKGAFTGAHVQRRGRMETAGGGTLFLDEVGELPLPLQVKLLRFLQEQRIERIGGREEIQIDTRIIAATNTDLTKAMKDGAFREDLYYRLAVVVVKLPPLRERTSDITLLAQALLQKFASDTGKQLLKFNQEAIRALEQHNWPGNVRELENRIKRAVIMAEGPQVTKQDLELADASAAVAGRTLQKAREAVEREMIQQALRRHNGKISPAAAELGISRPTFYELMDKLGIQKE
jgi:two-component system NtrC family response regulator